MYNYDVDSSRNLLWIQNHFAKAERLWKLVSSDRGTILSSRSALLQKQVLGLELMRDFDLWSTAHSCRGNASIFCPSPFGELHFGGVSSKSHCKKAWGSKRCYWNGISVSAYKSIPPKDIKLSRDTRVYNINMSKLLTCTDIFCSYHNMANQFKSVQSLYKPGIP